MCSFAVANLPDERLDSASTAIDLIKSDLSDDLAAMLPNCDALADDSAIAGGWNCLLAELLDLLDLTGELVGESLLQRLQLIYH